MVNLLAVCCAIFLLLETAEFLHRRHVLPEEVSRKLVHMGTGTIVAFTPYLMEWKYIQALSLAFLVVILLSLKFKIFRSIHSVKRVTRGEILYAVGIGICALLEPAPWIFVAGVLHLAIADAFAAVAGIHWGKRTSYTLLSHGKSMLGSLVFFYTSMLIMAGALVFVEPQNLPNAYFLLFVAPAILTVLENLSWYGLDNVTIPIMVIVLLSSSM